MVGGTSGLQIQRYYLPSDAPTTTGCHYKCEDGSRWRPLEMWEPREATGMQIAVKIGDRVFPKQ